MKTKTPTIRQLLLCLPAEGIEGLKPQLELYAALSHYFDGVDMRNDKINKIKSKQKLMDDLNPVRELKIIEGDDDVTLTIEGLGDFLFNMPTLNSMPDIQPKNLPGTIRESIKKLAADPDSVLELPYQYFSAVCDVLGKLIGS